MSASRQNQASSPFASALKNWRRLRGVSQEQLAARVGISTRHFSFLEVGRSQPSRETALAIGQALEARAGGWPRLSARSGPPRSGLGRTEQPADGEVRFVLCPEASPGCDATPNVELGAGARPLRAIGRFAQPDDADEEWTALTVPGIEPGRYWLEPRLLTPDGKLSVLSNTDYARPVTVVAEPQQLEIEP
jgi:transcriptional regulator with XRE-family HTH domain